MSKTIVNSASADARADLSTEATSSQLKPVVRKDFTTKESKQHDSHDTPESRPNKRPRFNKAKPGRRGGAAYTKREPPKSLQIVPRRTHFPVFLSNLGCRILSRLTYQVMAAKDYRLAQNITALQLCYVLTIAFCNRCVQTALKYGYAFPLGASRLKQVATGIQLPSVLAKYIEAIGRFELSSGAVVVPDVTGYPFMFRRYRPEMVDPAAILAEAERPVPAGDWAIDVEWIVQYNDATSRASRSGMQFRTVDNSVLEGRVEQLVSYVPDADHMVLPKGPQRMTEAEAQLGAVYHFRNYRNVDLWPGPNRELLFDAFTAIPCDPAVVFSDICVAAFSGAVVVTTE